MVEIIQTEDSIDGVITEIEIIEETWNTENNVLQETIEEMIDAEMVNINFELIKFLLILSLMQISRRVQTFILTQISFFNPNRSRSFEGQISSKRKRRL